MESACSRRPPSVLVVEPLQPPRRRWRGHNTMKPLHRCQADQATDGECRDPEPRTGPELIRRWKQPDRGERSPERESKGGKGMDPPLRHHDPRVGRITREGPAEPASRGTGPYA